MLNWEVVYQSQKQHEVVLVQQVFKTYQIDSVIINQQDSSYGTAFSGTIKLLVQSKEVQLAKDIIEHVIPF